MSWAIAPEKKTPDASIIVYKMPTQKLATCHNFSGCNLNLLFSIWPLPFKTNCLFEDPQNPSMRLKFIGYLFNYLQELLKTYQDGVWKEKKNWETVYSL